MTALFHLHAQHITTLATHSHPPCMPTDAQLGEGRLSKATSQQSNVSAKQRARFAHLRTTHAQYCALATCMHVCMHILTMHTPTMHVLSRISSLIEPVDVLCSCCTSAQSTHPVNSLTMGPTGGLTGGPTGGLTGGRSNCDSASTLLHWHVACGII